MFTVVEIGGQQFTVVKGDKLDVKKIAGKEGDKVIFDKVYLFNDGKNIEIGMPVVKGMVVEAKILKQKKGEKIRVFKMKAKKRYARTHGHRSHITEIEILDIKKKAALAETVPPKPVTKPVAKPAAKPAAKAPAKLPATKAPTKPTARSTARPAVKPAAKPAAKAPKKKSKKA